MPDLLTLTEIGAKAALHLGVLTAAGLVIARLVFAAHLDAQDRQVRRAAAAFAILGLAAAFLSFLLRGAALTGDLSGMRDPEMLGLLWQTPVGTVLWQRCAGLGLILIGGAFGGWALWVALAGGLLALWSFSGVGHTFGTEELWPRLVLFAHLLGVAFWIGILLPLSRLVLDPATHDQAARLGQAFGRIAQVAVPVLLVAGLALTLRLVGTPENLIGTAYGQALVIKLLLVIGLLTLAAANKLRFVPALQAGEPQAARHLRRSIALEWAAFIAIFITTATFSSVLTPP